MELGLAFGHFSVAGRFNPVGKRCLAASGEFVGVVGNTANCARITWIRCSGVDL